MASGNVFQIKLHQTYGDGGKNLLNVFYYRQDDGVLGSHSLWNQFDFYVVPKLAAFMHVKIKFTVGEVINLDDPADYWTDTPNTASGLSDAGGDCLPQFVCYAFRFGRVTRAVRNGQKRIAGVPEGAQVDGTVTHAATLTQLGDAALAMALTLPDATEDSHWSPRIFRPHTERPGKPDLERADFAVGGVNFIRLSSQNTRK